MNNPGAQLERRTDTSAIVALVAGFMSLAGLVVPPLLIAGLAAVILGWTARRRIPRGGAELKGKGIATAAMALGIVGSLLSLVVPGFIAYVWIYAAFHGGQCPNNGC